MTTTRDESVKALIEDMRSLARALSTCSDFPFEEVQINRNQASILFYIFRSKKGATVKELAEFLQVTSGAVTQFIDTLVEKNLVSRIYDTEDRRVQHINLTGSARKHFDVFTKRFYERVSTIFTDLSDKELAQLHTLIKKIQPKG
jgi:DNA-binding MarR family transcriptional regulator